MGPGGDRAERRQRRQGGWDKLNGVAGSLESGGERGREGWGWWRRSTIPNRRGRWRERGWGRMIRLNEVRIEGCSGRR